MSEEKRQLTPALLYAETAVAIMDNIHTAGFSEAYYAIHADHDGCTGMWSSVGLVAIALEDAIGAKWAGEERDFIADMIDVVRPLMKFNQEIKLIETRIDAEEFVKWFLAGGDHYKGQEG